MDCQELALNTIDLATQGIAFEKFMQNFFLKYNGAVFYSEKT